MRYSTIIAILHPAQPQPQSQPHPKPQTLILTLILLFSEDLSGEVLKTNQFSVTYHFRELDQSVGRGLPGVFVFYDLSPIMCTFKETRRSLAKFLTGVCAIVGGIFTVSGLLDRVVYRGSEALKKKMNKFN